MNTKFVLIIIINETFYSSGSTSTIGKMIFLALE